MRRTMSLGFLVVALAAGSAQAAAPFDPALIGGQWTGTFTGNLKQASSGVIDCATFTPMEFDPFFGSLLGKGLSDQGATFQFTSDYRMVRRTIHIDPDRVSCVDCFGLVTGETIGKLYVWIQGSVNSRVTQMKLKLVSENLEKFNLRLTPAPPVTLSIAPPDPTVDANSVTNFTATVTGSPNTAVRWVVVESTGGTIDQSGTYTAPPFNGTYHVVATSLANGCVTATVTITVTGGPP